MTDMTIPLNSVIWSTAQPPVGQVAAGTNLLPPNESPWYGPWVPISCATVEAWATMTQTPGNPSNTGALAIQLSNDGVNVATTSGNVNVVETGVGSAVCSMPSEGYAFARVTLVATGGYGIVAYSATMLAVPELNGGTGTGGGGNGGGIYGSGVIGDYELKVGSPAIVHTSNLTNDVGNMAMNAPGAVPAGLSAGQAALASYWASLDGDMNFHNLTIDAGMMLAMVGDRIFVSGTLILNGLIDYNAVAPNYMSGGSAGGGGSGALDTDPLGSTAAGANGGTGNGAEGGGITGQWAVTVGGIAQLGGKGGAGGAGSGTTGGISPNVNALHENLGMPYQAPLGYGLTGQGVIGWGGGNGGGAGGGDGTNSGGSGGGGGGTIVICAKNIVGTGTIWSSGGDGQSAVAGVCGGGGGGGGGGVIIVTESAVYNPATKLYYIPGITVAAPAGNLGAGFGGGANGHAGSPGNVVIIPG